MVDDGSPKPRAGVQFSLTPPKMLHRTYKCKVRKKFWSIHMFNSSYSKKIEISCYDLKDENYFYMNQWIELVRCESKILKVNKRSSPTMTRNIMTTFQSSKHDKIVGDYKTVRDRIFRLIKELTE